jgi:peptidoglycan hydrolase-like protein with peptidoglycan-binding domain
MFSALPFAGAAEVQNTDANQNMSQATSIKNAVMDHGLMEGSEGKYVVKLQKWLKTQGYYTGDVDGSFGPYTKQAVKYFQNDSDIVVDGWVANQTVNAMEELTGENIFRDSKDSTSSSISSKKAKSTNKSKNSANNVTSDSTSEKTGTDDSNVSKTEATKNSSTSSTSKSVSAKTSISLSEILASGAKYGYSHSASTAAGMIACGSGDCWAMSDYLYSKLQAAGIESRIVQYSTAYSARHRSVQLYQNGAWVDVPYSSYGYSTMFKATSSKPGLTVIAS